MRRAVLVVVMLGLMMPGSGRGDHAAARGEETTVVSASAVLCETTEVSPACQAVGGIVINVRLASGEAIGSCTLGEPVATPWGGEMAMCAVEGVPFNADIVATQDPATIPAGYYPTNDPQQVHIGNVPPGGGDQTTFSFLNARVPDGPVEQTPAQQVPIQQGEVGDGQHAALVAGQCASREWTLLADLTPVTMAGGEPVGQSQAVEAGTSYSTVGLGLDGIIDGPSAVVVRESSEPDSPVIACGDVGGVNNHDGELVIMLLPEGGSGYTGVARLAYNPADASLTDITIFLGEDGT